MTKLIPCKVCGETIAPSAEFCPHCGAKPRKHHRLLSAIAVGGILIAAIFIISSPDSERGSQPSPEKEPAQRSEKPAQPLDKNAELLRRLAEIEHTPASQLTAGELGPIYIPLSEHTDVQRENTTKEITGQIVDWTIPVYEVTKNAPDEYQIQALAKTDFVGTIATVHTRSEREREFVERLKWGDLVRIKGKIMRVLLRQVLISDAIVFAPASEPHVSEVR